MSQTTVPDLVPDTSSEDDDEDEVKSVDEEDADDGKEVLTMSPAEIRVIRRISARANVLPVIAHSDSLTDEKLQAVKKAVLTGLQQAGIDLGVFAPPRSESTPTPKRKTKFAAPSSENGASADGDTEKQEESTPEAKEPKAKEEESEEESEEEERVSRPVIKLRAKRPARALSRSRSRRDLSQVAEDNDLRPVSPDDIDSVANVRFSAHIVAKQPVTSLLPFALIAPEPHRKRLKFDSAAQSEKGTSSPQASETASETGVPQTAASTKSFKHVPFLSAPPEDLKGVFVRKYRWGTIDVLDPSHCDFAAMRTAVLSTHLKVCFLLDLIELVLKTAVAP